MKNGIRKDNNGFTLIELIITIAVLAVISVPLLMYFTDAVKYSAKTREEQNAVVAAQNTLEELKAADYSLDLPDALIATSGAIQPGWALQTPPDADGTYTVARACNVNGRSYKVKAVITPHDELTNDTGTLVTYQDAVIPSMDSASDVIATETGQILADAKFYFYGLYAKECEKQKVARDASVTMTSIGDHLQREIQLSMEKDPAKSGNVLAKITYSYQYILQSGESYPLGIDGSSAYHEEIEKRSIVADDMKDIYLFFRPDSKYDSLKIEGTVGNLMGLKNDQLNLYLIAQDSVPASEAASVVPGSSITVRSMTYQMKLPVTCGGNLNDCFAGVYTNLSATSPNEVSGGVFAAKLQKEGTAYTLVKRETKNRVADIEVSVYKGDSLSETNRFTTVTGSKVQ